MNGNPVTATSLKEMAYQFIQSRILNRELVAGGVISELSISKDLGISRTPVREAINQLLGEGLLDQIPGRGTVVKRPTRRDIIELYELREALEVYAVGKAAEHRLNPNDYESLSRLCSQFLVFADELEAGGTRWLEPDQMQRTVAVDFQFHLLLLRAAGNGRILRVVNDTRVLMRIFAIRREGHDARLLKMINEYHKRILESVQSGDAASAMRAMGEHIRLSREERLSDFDRWERTSQIDLSYLAYFALNE